MTDKHEADVQRITGENAYTDLTRFGENLSKGDGFLLKMINGVVSPIVDRNPNKKAVWDSTDFGAKDLALNQMLDLVEGTDPEDLESSGRALWDARDAIKAAAEELDGHIGKVHWVGQAGHDFRQWGLKLVASTTQLSTFAGAAGDQLSSAAMGLASVRGAMPARDSEANRKRPEHFTEAEKTANKEQYDAAVRVEKDRQEAINQMNRLASYYAVSGKELQDLKAPTFHSMPNVGVPAPAKGYRPGESTSRVGEGSTTTGVTNRNSVDSSTGHGVVDSAKPPAQEVPGRVARPDVPVGTNIDSVDTLLPRATPPATGPTPPLTGTPPMGGGQNYLPDGALGTPMPNGTQGRNLGGTGGLRNPSASGQGRPNTPGLNNQGVGRASGQGPINQMGRSTPTGQAAGKGLVSGSQSSQMGRGISGGTPRAGGTATPRTNAAPTTGAGRSNGVVGGRPATGNASAKGGGSRIPRGTIVGGEGAANSRSTTGRPGQRGVFGAPDPTARPGSGGAVPRTGSGGADPVTGRPIVRNSTAGAERNGLTRGGAGLVRGSGQNGKPDDDDVQATPRPDYVVEDQETHLPNKPRRDVPPVVN
ncbi:hypothetical protein [Streptomyces sp. YU58]|uniref:hypothetical protein n=1 Tax=Streptomyces sp. SX92 TaxID=3158972 RepID=UPI0027BA0DA5|nr:hypothetical protein [Streptomyces coralus]WLW51820.1 hypothetical protein QU709_10735 [Streptomyces coralus]